MLGDELFQAPLLGTSWWPGRLSRNCAPLAGKLPFILILILIFRRRTQSLRYDSVPHRKISVVFAVQEARRRRDGSSGHNFGDEDNSSSLFVVVLAANVEA